LSAALSGLVLGYYYLRYGSLVQVILLHAMNNLTVCFMMSIGVAEKSISEIVASDAIYWTIYVFAAIISLYSLGVMIRQLRMRRGANISAKQ
jgi:membrane protease YdiL (CAAX protease family)